MSALAGIEITYKDGVTKYWVIRNGVREFVSKTRMEAEAVRDAINNLVAIPEEEL